MLVELINLVPLCQKLFVNGTYIRSKLIYISVALYLGCDDLVALVVVLLKLDSQIQRLLAHFLDLLLKLLLFIEELNLTVDAVQCENTILKLLLPALLLLDTVHYAR